MTNLIRFDWAIKKILRDKANFGILEGFLSELLNQTIKIINILDSESNKETSDDKFNRVDLLAELESKELVVIEVQNTEELDYLHRILYGTSKTISENMKKGESYSNVKKVISISIVYFELGEGSDYVYHGTTNFLGIHNHDQLKLSEKQANLFKISDPHQVFPEYYLLKVESFDNETKDGLDEWIYFLKNEEIKDNFKAKGLIEAKEKLDVMKLLPNEQAVYNRYIENLHYKASMLETETFLLNEKIRNATEKATIEATIKAKKENSIEIAKNLKDRGFDLRTILEVTSLSLEEIEKL